MSTKRHHDLLGELEASGARDWSTECLLACLRRLDTGGLTEAHLVELLDAWTGPGDTINVVYVPPWGTVAVGLRRNRSSAAISTYPDYSGSVAMSPRDFGRNVADWDIGEPLGIPESLMWHDSQGIRWWGDSGGIDPGVEMMK